MRIVLDTNILVRASVKARGPARELFQLLVASPDHTLVVSPFLLQELERVLSYSRIRTLSKLNDDEIAEYLSYLQQPGIAELVFPGPSPRVVIADPDDDPVVHTAIAGGANVLCTLNRHFYSSDVLEYCHDRGVVVATDVDLLVLLRSFRY